VEELINPMMADVGLEGANLKVHVCVVLYFERISVWLVGPSCALVLKEIS